MTALRRWLEALAVLAGLAMLAVVVLLVAAPPRAPAVRWDAAVAVILDDRPGRPGSARPRARGPPRAAPLVDLQRRPGTGTSSPSTDPPPGARMPAALSFNDCPSIP